MFGPDPDPLSVSFITARQGERWKIERDRERQRETERDRERQREAERGRERQIETDRARKRP